MLVDEITIRAKAGRGGNGIVAWKHEKGKEFMGPGGGDGGRGGNVYVEGVSDIGILAKYRNVKEIAAGDGESGQNFSRTGKSGEDAVFLVPVGAVITNLSTGERKEIITAGEKVLVLSGGEGGLGNERFKSSRNTSPKQSTPGLDGEEADISIELLMIADVGLVGLPNAGKSSILNALTKSAAKIGNYPFTTLEPNLGAYHGLIIADIPGLIEGASGGKGLGDKFLRHIKRTRLLVYCVSSELPDPVKGFEVVKNELLTYDKALLDRPFIIALTKTDLLSSPEDIKSLVAGLSSLGKVVPVSILDEPSLKALGDAITSAARNGDLAE